MSIPYFNFYPEAWLDGTKALDDTQKAIYIDLLAILYERDGELDDDLRDVAHLLRRDIRQWKRVRLELIQLGKLEVANGQLRNSRAIAELELRRSKLEANRENGKKPKRKQQNREAVAQPALSDGVRHKRLEIREDSVEPKEGSTGADAPQNLFEAEPRQPAPEPIPEPPSAKEQIWAIAKPMLERAGTTKAAAGAVIGRLVKLRGETEALQIIQRMRADVPADPESYLWKIINGGAKAQAVDPGAGQTSRVERQADGSLVRIDIATGAILARTEPRVAA